MSTGKAVGTGLDDFKGRTLGRILIKLGKLTRTEVHHALEFQKQQGKPIGEILVALGYVTEADVQNALRLQSGQA